MTRCFAQAASTNDPEDLKKAQAAITALRKTIDPNTQGEFANRTKDLYGTQFLCNYFIGDKETHKRVRAHKHLKHLATTSLPDFSQGIKGFYEVQYALTSLLCLVNSKLDTHPQTAKCYSVAL